MTIRTVLGLGLIGVIGLPVFLYGMQGLDQETRYLVDLTCQEMEGSWEQSKGDVVKQGQALQDYANKTCKLYETLIREQEQPTDLMAAFCDYCVYTKQVIERGWYQAALGMLTSGADAEVGQLPLQLITIPGLFCFRQSNYALMDKVVSAVEKWERVNKSHDGSFYSDAFVVALLPASAYMPDIKIRELLIQKTPGYFFAKNLLAKAAKQGDVSHGIVSLLLKLDDAWGTTKLPEDMQCHVLDELLAHVHKRDKYDFVVDDQMRTSLRCVRDAQKRVKNEQIRMVLGKMEALLK
jgi:hypothetical protein